MNRTDRGRSNCGTKTLAAAMTLCGLTFLTGCGFNPFALVEDLADLVVDRVGVAVVDTVFDEFFSSLCAFRDDGICDDGRPGAITDLCPFGTDPEDCVGEDNQFCTGLVTCTIPFGCQGGTPPNCDDTVACTDDSCDTTASGGTGACLSMPNDGNCDDDQFCNGVETCDASLGCKAGTVPTCDDGNACTADTCDPAGDDGAGACVHFRNDFGCDDNQFCNGVETCGAMLDCQAGTAPNCDDGDDCTDDSCDTTADGGTGACVHFFNGCIGGDANPPPP